MYNEYNQPFDWDFEEDNTVIYREPASDEEVEEMIDDALATVKIEGENLVYKLMVNGQEAGEINIPKDQFLKNVYYDAENHQLVFPLCHPTSNPHPSRRGKRY